MNVRKNTKLRPVDGLPQPVDSVSDMAYRVPDPLPKKSFVMYVCGQPGSGKSNLWLQLLMSKPTKRNPSASKYYYKYFDKIFLISGSIATLPMDKLGLKDERVYSEYSDAVMHDIVEGERADENNNTLIVLDDIIRSIKNKNSEELTKAILNRRHCTQNTEEDGQAGLSIILTSQVYNYLFLGLRKNASHVILFRTENQKEKRSIKSELMGDLTDKQADDVMNTAWDGKHNFLLICAEKPTSERYYRNFDLIEL
jgi:hypothetical protein